MVFVVVVVVLFLFLFIVLFFVVFFIFFFFHVYIFRNEINLLYLLIAMVMTFVCVIFAISPINNHAF